MYSQNQEEKIILEYFKEFKGRLLDIGANDGKTLSNSLALIEKGWKAYLVEPSEAAYKKLEILHDSNARVMLYNVAIGNETGEVDFYDSGTHLNKGDTSLLSTIVERETIKWRASTQFDKKKVKVLTYKELFRETKFDFISIDAEGMDWEILRQIDLSFTKMLCIEYNNNPIVKELFGGYCAKFGMRLHHENYENLIFIK